MLLEVPRDLAADWTTTLGTLQTQVNAAATNLIKYDKLRMEARIKQADHSRQTESYTNRITSILESAKAIISRELTELLEIEKEMAYGDR